MKRRPAAVAIVGAGGLARALASALGSAGGVTVTLAARRPGAAAAAARGLRGVLAARRIEDAIAGASIVMLAVPDRAIAPVARELAPLRASWRGVVALHAGGAYGPELLSALKRRGAATGVLHPLAVLGRGSSAPLAGAFARIEGAPAAAAAARRLARLAGLVSLSARRIRTRESRRAYHAAASLASNDVIALLASARRILVRCGVPSREALRALVVLASGALAEAGRVGVSKALTGPVVRNDAETLAAQLAALARRDPAAAAAHRALSTILIETAEASGRLDAKAARLLRRLLAGTV